MTDQVKMEKDSSHSGFLILNLYTSGVFIKEKKKTLCYTMARYTASWCTFVINTWVDYMGLRERFMGNI